MGRVRRCDSRCHNAKKPRCRCWCGGHYHGSQGAGNREALVSNRLEADQALLLQQHGFKEGETKYVQQLQLEKPKPQETWQEYFAGKNDKELQNEVLALHDLIHNAECFGSKDLIFYEGAIGELERRGYELQVVSTIKFKGGEPCQ